LWYTSNHPESMVAFVENNTFRTQDQVREQVAAHYRQMEWEPRDLEGRCQALEAKLAIQVAHLRVEHQDLKVLSSQPNAIAQPAPRAATKKPRRHN
jgi:hypothetical protein